MTTVWSGHLRNSLTHTHTHTLTHTHTHAGTHARTHARTHTHTHVVTTVGVRGEVMVWGGENTDNSQDGNWDVHINTPGGMCGFFFCLPPPCLWVIYASLGGREITSLYARPCISADNEDHSSDTFMDFNYAAISASKLTVTPHWNMLLCSLRTMRWAEHFKLLTALVCLFRMC